IRQHDRACLRPLPGISRGRARGGRSSHGRRPSPRVLLQPERRDDPLRDGLRSGILRCGICEAGRVVAGRFFGLPGEPGGVARIGIDMVEIGRYLVAALVLAVAAPAEELRYWIEPCERAETGCRPGDPELAQWAMDAWQAESDGKLKLLRTSD